MDSGKKQVIPGKSTSNDNNAIIAIMEGTSGHTGEQFFKILVKKLSLVLNTSGAWVTEYIEKEERLRAFAFWLNGQWVENYEYVLKGTPCEPVIKNACRVHLPEKVVELYPKDPDLKEYKAVSYLGEPLTDSAGKVIGHLAIMDSKPMPPDPGKLAIFRIFSARAAAEITRLNAEKQLRAREEKLARLIESAMDGIAEFDEKLVITQLNPAAEKILSVKDTEVSGNKIITDYIGHEDRAKLRIIARRLLSSTVNERSLWVPGGLEIRSSRGVTIRTEATLSLSGTEGNHHLTLIFRDVNDRLEAERKINALISETQYLKEELSTIQGSGELKGNSPGLLKVKKDIQQVATTDSTVLITGETGTGKELVARAIHRESKRNDKPLIKVNCGAIPSNLIESEFFGHEKGAFTGATSKRDGRFKLADGGTIFLDEIGELPLDLQSKLLRVLQEGEFEPVGSSRTVKINTRVLAATNRNLKKEVREGRFREDLFYRLNVFPIEVPPLRERGDDIIDLAEQFIREYSVRIGRKVKPLTEEMKSRLLSYNWPGNVRELQNVIERAVITSEKGVLNFDVSLTGAPDIKVLENTESREYRVLTANEMQELEKDNLIRALRKTNWKVSGEDGAATLLGIPPTTLSSRMKSLGIKKPG